MHIIQACVRGKPACGTRDCGAGCSVGYRVTCEIAENNVSAFGAGCFDLMQQQQHQHIRVVFVAFRRDIEVATLRSRHRGQGTHRQADLAQTLRDRVEHMMAEPNRPAPNVP